VGAWERGLVSISQPRLGWQASAYGTTARLAAASAFAALLFFVLAVEARAEDGSAQSGGPAAADPAGPGEPAGETAPPPAGDTGQEEPAAPGPADEAPPGEAPPQEPPPVVEAPPPDEAPAESPPPPGEVPPPAQESPPAEPAPPPEPAPESPVVPPPPPDDLTPEPAPVPERPPDEVPAADSQRNPIVVIERGTPPLRLPSLLPSPVDSLAATTGGGDRLGTEGGSRTQSGSEGSHPVESARDVPPLPGLPFSGGAPSDLYVSAGGSSGSSGGFFPLVLAGLVAFLAAGAQRRSGLLSLALAPPRCAAFVRCLERPD
jgi:hypothetical protein